MRLARHNDRLDRAFGHGETAPRPTMVELLAEPSEEEVWADFRRRHAVQIATYATATPYEPTRADAEAPQPAIRIAADVVNSAILADLGTDVARIHDEALAAEPRPARPPVTIAQLEAARRRRGREERALQRRMLDEMIDRFKARLDLSRVTES